MEAGKPSTTAILIARSFVFMSRDRILGPLISASALHLSTAFATSAIGSFRVRLLRILGNWALARTIVRFMQRLSVPGLLPHFILRKKCLEDLVLMADDKLGGLEQLVILGAGFDTLGARLADLKTGLRILEIDHPATQSLKVRAFASGSVVQPPNLTLRPADLARESLKAVLEDQKDFSFHKSTLFLSEGVFMYLPITELEKSLSILNEFPRGRSHFIFTYMLPDKDGRACFRGQSRATNAWLKKQSEPFIWGKTPQEMDAFLQKKGYESLKHVDAAALREKYLPADTPPGFVTAEGENIVWLENAVRS